MAITETREIQIADVSVTDAYGVMLEQEFEQRVYTPEQARELAQLLVDAADGADTMEQTDLRAAAERQDRAGSEAVI